MIQIRDESLASQESVTKEKGLMGESIVISVRGRTKKAKRIVMTHVRMIKWLKMRINDSIQMDVVPDPVILPLTSFVSKSASIATS